MRIAIIILIFLYSIPTLASDAEFGQYRYTQYLGIQQQLQNQRANAIRRQRMYNQSPTRNIQYPSANNPYPNIQRSYAARISPRQRYSSQYYNRYYRL